MDIFMNKPGGKGDRNRSNSKAYRDNFDKIDWSREIIRIYHDDVSRYQKAAFKGMQNAKDKGR